MIKQKLTAFIAVLILIASCSQNDPETVQRKTDSLKATGNHDKLNEEEREDTIFQNVVFKKEALSGNISENLHENLSDVFDHYISLKNELAENDSIDSRKQAYEILDVVLKTSEEKENKLDKKWTLVGDKLMKYRKVIENSVTLKEQRDWFGKLTESLTEAIQQYGIPDRKIYELGTINSSEAKNTKWLTDSKDIDDPYNGDKNNRNVVVLRAWEFD